ncbi:YIP1 family protein [Yoonia sp. SS1-5]|uniref:YIP1 family protein n=1 Tax=Yoonia rhodophyticola TaxID=3137370 RepID=A0AAN0NJK7_9RHOB
MPVTSDIIETWRAPRAVTRRILDQGRREDRAMAFVMIACFLIFVAQWPRLSRKAAGFDLAPGADVPELNQLMAYEFLAWVMVWPLFLYALAALSHLVAKALGGQGDWYGARIALFWTLLATVPVLLLHGLTAGFVGPGLQTNIVGGIWVLGFLYIWVQSLREAERRS